MCKEPEFLCLYMMIRTQAGSTAPDGCTHFLSQGWEGRPFGKPHTDLAKWSVCWRDVDGLEWEQQMGLETQMRVGVCLYLTPIQQQQLESLGVIMLWLVEI